MCLVSQTIVVVPTLHTCVLRGLPMQQQVTGFSIVSSSSLPMIFPVPAGALMSKTLFPAQLFGSEQRLQEMELMEYPVILLFVSSIKSAKHE